MPTTAWAIWFPSPTRWAGVTRYQYDENGNLAAMTDARGEPLSLEYNKNGSATSHQKNGGVLATGYDKAGRVVSKPTRTATPQSMATTGTA